MEMTPKRRLELVSGKTHPGLAEEIASCLGVTLSETNIRRFADGEIHCRFDASMRGADMFIVQTHAGPVNDSIMEQLIMVDAAKRASAHRITAVCPYYGYSRQDRKATGREPITAKLVADLLSAAGVDRVVSVDLHSGQIQGFFDVPVDHLTAAPVLLDYLRQYGSSDLVVIAPDAGRVKVAERYSQLLDTDLALVHKRHPRGTYNEVEAMDVVGIVRGRPCVIIDDLIDTAGTVCAAAYRLVEAGAGT
jgi:ribose-phosphate pyrophosphokinase